MSFWRKYLTMYHSNLHSHLHGCVTSNPHSKDVDSFLELHWLTVHHRLVYKLCTLMFAVHKSKTSVYITELVNTVIYIVAKCALCSTNMLSLTSVQDNSLASAQTSHFQIQTKTCSPKIVSNNTPCSWQQLRFEQNAAARSLIEISVTKLHLSSC